MGLWLRFLLIRMQHSFYFWNTLRLSAMSVDSLFVTTDTTCDGFAIGLTRLDTPIYVNLIKRWFDSIECTCLATVMIAAEPSQNVHKAIILLLCAAGSST